MVRGQFRSRTFRRIMRRLPGGSTVLRYVRRKPGVPTCAVTGKPLQGVARGTPAQIKKLSKSQRMPNRPFGGVLSSSAARREIISKSRK